jgi:hypothetical protein
MHANTLKILADLKALNLDTTQLETSLAANSQADNYLGAGITRQQTFNQIIGEKRRVEGTLQEVQNQLAAMQTQIQGGNLNAATVTAINAWKTNLRQFLIDEEYPESQLNEVFKPLDNAIAASQTPNPDSSSRTVTPPPSNSGQQNKGVAMTDEERTALRNESAAVGAALGVGLNFNIQRAMAEFNSVYGRFPNGQEIANLETAVSTRHIQGGENLDSVIDETFKISAQRTVNETTARAKEITEAENRGRAAAYQEAGIIPGGKPQGGRISRAPVFSRANNNIPRTNSGDAPPPANNTPPPAAPVVNSPDANIALKDSSGLLPFQQRGNKQTRMNHLATVAAERPDLFQNDGYEPVYGRTPPQQ